MAQIMETDNSKLIPLQEQAKVVCNIIRAEEFAHLIYTDIIGIGVVVAFLKQPAVIFLPVFYLLKEHPNLWNQRQGTETGFCFQLIRGSGRYLCAGRGCHREEVA